MSRAKLVKLETLVVGDVFKFQHYIIGEWVVQTLHASGEGNPRCQRIGYASQSKPFLGPIEVLLVRKASA